MRKRITAHLSLVLSGSLDRLSPTVLGLSPHLSPNVTGRGLTSDMAEGRLGFTLG
jgi:hypothetical protein